MVTTIGSKRSIFEAVLARLGPQSAATVLRNADQGMLDSDPPGFIRTLAARVSRPGTPLSAAADQRDEPRRPHPRPAAGRRH